MRRKRVPFYDIDKLPLEDYTQVPRCEIASKNKAGERRCYG